MLGGGLCIAASYMDQQSEHTQPMPKSWGYKYGYFFNESTITESKVYEREMALIQNRAESRTPGAQYGGSLLDAA